MNSSDPPDHQLPSGELLYDSLNDLASRLRLLAAQVERLKRALCDEERNTAPSFEAMREIHSADDTVQRLAGQLASLEQHLVRSSP